jgi:hypothetical protein
MRVNEQACAEQRQPFEPQKRPDLAGGLSKCLFHAHRDSAARIKRELPKIV